MLFIYTFLFLLDMFILFICSCVNSTLNILTCIYISGDVYMQTVLVTLYNYFAYMSMYCAFIHVSYFITVLQ